MHGDPSTCKIISKGSAKWKRLKTSDVCGRLRAKSKILTREIKCVNFRRFSTSGDLWSLELRICSPITSAIGKIRPILVLFFFLSNFRIRISPYGKKRTDRLQDTCNARWLNGVTVRTLDLRSTAWSTVVSLTFGRVAIQWLLLDGWLFCL